MMQKQKFLNIWMDKEVIRMFVDQCYVKRLIQSGVELIAAGANVPFSDKEIFYGTIRLRHLGNCVSVRL